jgi:glycosyl hydrolase family 3
MRMLILAALAILSVSSLEAQPTMPPDSESEQRVESILCAINKRCVVIVTAGGAVDMTEWLERVPGLLQSWYLGQEGGKALARVLTGSVNPSGHLPVTFETRLEDNPVYHTYYPEPNTNRVHYKEGVFVGYLGYEKRASSLNFHSATDCPTPLSTTAIFWCSRRPTRPQPYMMFRLL